MPGLEFAFSPGKHSPTQGIQMNLYFYTAAKAASDYVAHRIILPVAAIHEMTHHDFEHESFQSGKTLDDVIAQHRDLLHTDNNYFGPFRHGSITGHHHGPNDKVILHLRDPRDCLTSLYYSILHSHPVPEGAGKDDFLKFRAQVASRSIDEQCLLQSRGYIRLYNNYIDLYKNSENIFLSRYEDMVSDFENWLNGIFTFTQAPLNHFHFTNILDNADFQVDKEDISKHKRRVVPGDFLDKLAPATIQQLNEKFSAALECFGYPEVPPSYRIWKRGA
jgi:hypothetical protein